MIKALTAIFKSIITLSNLTNSVITHFSTDFTAYSKETQAAKKELSEVYNERKIDMILEKMQALEETDLTASSKKLISDKLNALLIEELNNE